MAATVTKKQDQTEEAKASSDLIDAAIEHVVSNNGAINDKWVSERGIEFRLKKFSRAGLVAAGKQLKEPEVPKNYIEDDDRWEENPNHPDYIAARMEYLARISDLTIDTFIVLGSELMRCPDDVPGPDSEEWIELLEASGIDVPHNDKKHLRYKYWVKWYALNEIETVELVRAGRRMNGSVLEEDVSAVAEHFKSDEGRGADTESTASETES